MPKKSYEVKLRRARLVMGWVTIFRGSTMPLFSRQLRPTQPDHPSVGTGDGFGHQWGRNGEFCVAVQAILLGLLASSSTLSYPFIYGCQTQSYNILAS